MKKRGINEEKREHYICSSNKYAINSSDERIYNKIGNLLENYAMENGNWKRS